jgi:hypothetical protein
MSDHPRCQVTGDVTSCLLWPGWDAPTTAFPSCEALRSHLLNAFPEQGSPIGGAIDGTKIRVVIVEENGKGFRQVRQGEVGELLVSGAHVSDGSFLNHLCESRVKSRNHELLC